MLPATVRNHSSMTVFKRDVRAETTPGKSRLLLLTCVSGLVKKSSRCRSSCRGVANVLFLHTQGMIGLNIKIQSRKSSFISKPFKATWMYFVTSLHLQNTMQTPRPHGKAFHSQLWLPFKPHLQPLHSHVPSTFRLRFFKHPSLLFFCDSEQVIPLGDVVLFPLFFAK